MSLGLKLVTAARCGGYLGDLLPEQVRTLSDRGYARYVESTGRWVLTDAGHEAARRAEESMTPAERAQMDRANFGPDSAESVC